ncbi:hypothetical protein KUTeg_015724 [Tegillarca granosa]|uniref:Uncharacterized protein n=1 Tax=Tegillarca granosa TaxID=220873 RepID=A0ABQ9EN68_TEGGR|nr:hypothetical protein KUTeg_015724 [Tegillarca granosa]
MDKEDTKEITIKFNFMLCFQRKDTLIILKLDSCNVPRKLMGKSFLDWTSSTDKSFFWKRLFRSIGKPIDTT